MGKLLMSYKEIRDSIDLKEDSWNNIRGTNCYAFALGLDIPSGKLMSFGFEYPYDVGMIGAKKYGFSFFEIFGSSLEEKLFLDLDALGIKHKEVNQFELIEDDPRYLRWIIAMYKQVGSIDFHFLRKTSKNYWAHKAGIHGGISCLDSTGNLITNLDDAIFSYRDGNEIADYELQNVYELSLKR